MYKPIETDFDLQQVRHALDLC